MTTNVFRNVLKIESAEYCTQTAYPKMCFPSEVKGKRQQNQRPGQFSVYRTSVRS